MDERYCVFTSVAQITDMVWVRLLPQEFPPDIGTANKQTNEQTETKNKNPLNLRKTASCHNILWLYIYSLNCSSSVCFIIQGTECMIHFQATPLTIISKKLTLYIVNNSNHLP